MPVTTYTYPNVAANIPAGVVAPDRIEQLIEDSVITIQLGGSRVLYVAGTDTLTIEFKDILPAADKLALDGDSAQAENLPVGVGSVLADSLVGTPLPSPADLVEVVNQVTLSPTTEVSLAPATEVSLTSNTEVLVAGGTVASSADQRYENWSIPQISLNGSYQTVWQKTVSDFSFYEAIFHTSSDRIDVRVEVDALEIAEFDLNSLTGDFSLSVTGSNNAADFPIYEYGSNRFRFRPLVPIRANSDLTIQMRAQTGNRTLYRGISVWGLR